jgi:hypothetical protein
MRARRYDRLGFLALVLLGFRMMNLPVEAQEGGGRCRDTRVGEKRADPILGAPQFGRPKFQQVFDGDPQYGNLLKSSSTGRPPLYCNCDAKK